MKYKYIYRDHSPRGVSFVFIYIVTCVSVDWNIKILFDSAVFFAVDLKQLFEVNIFSRLFPK